MYPLTKFEIARLIGTRATQLANGATPCVDITGLDDAYKIAEKEFKSRRIPILVVRKGPGDKIEEVNPNERK